MTDWASTAIPAGAGLAGAALGYLGTIRVSRRERKAAQQTDLTRAIGRYLGVLYLFVSEMGELPATEPPGRITRLVDQVRGEAWTYVRTQRRLSKVFGERHFLVRQSLADAIAQLQVLELPPDFQEVFNDANAYAERLAAERTQALKDGWPEVYERLHASFRSATES